MILDHIGLSVSDSAKNKAFFAAALAPLGITLITELQGWAGFGLGGKPEFWFGEGAGAQKKHPRSEGAQSSESHERSRALHYFGQFLAAPIRRLFVAGKLEPANEAVRRKEFEG